MKYVFIAITLLFLFGFVAGILHDRNVNDCMEFGGRPTDSVEHVKKYTNCDFDAGWW